MTDFVHQHLRDTQDQCLKGTGVGRPALTCKDGSRLSVLAGPGASSVPREFAETYTWVEVWCWPKGDDTFSEDDSGPVSVETHTVNSWISKHGGLK